MNKNKNKIYMQDWLSLHLYQHISESDKWYLNFAQSLVPVLNESKLLKSLASQDIKELAVMLAAYFEDVVSEGGGWNRFHQLYTQTYNTVLPFYTTSEEYYMDEINLEDVQFLIWSFLSCPQEQIGDSYTLFDPFDMDLLQLGQDIYRLLDASFEDAPITEAQTIDWVMDIKQMSIKPKEMPLVELAQCSSESSKKVLEYTGGYPLVVFKTYDELTRFFVNVLEWEDTASSLMPDMRGFSNFVLFANSKGILLAPEVATYFKSKNNTLFSEKAAQKEAYLLFIEKGACPFDLLKYGISQGYLDEAQLPFSKGKDLLRENWDFLSRWYLGEFYEGD